MASVECPNREINLQMCPCPADSCDFKGICCLCIENHVSKGGKSYCMRGTARPPETRALRGVAVERCERHSVNIEQCACSYTPCSNRGTCCDCVRNHWGDSTYPSPACMRG